ncbi:MAG: sulfotransferase [Proteobacteria bacterium]|nr:sulfotransferase [Pseudomonadota bacterium]
MGNTSRGRSPNPQVNSPNPQELLRMGRAEEARALAARAVDGARSCLPMHGFLASVLIVLGRRAEAAATVDAALALGGASADACDGLAFACAELGRHELANTLYRRATELAAGDPRFWYNLACSERNLGRLAAAGDACTRAIACDATQYPSWLLRSELRVQTDADNHVEALEQQLAQARADYRAQVFLGYALGKELDDLGRCDEAFAAFEGAAHARRSRLRYEVADDERKLARIAACYPQPGAAPGDTAAGAGCIFVVGLPRSGTTLVERILTGLPGVRSNGETANFSRALLEAAGDGTADVFERAAGADAGAVAALYGRYAGVDGREAVVEKLPLNYLYLGAIHRALPAAKVLWVTRSPLDSCFAMYRTLFGAAYPFSYDFGELARYYGAYRRLMRHWQATLGPWVHEVVYEDLVADPRTVGARIARHCGLTWDEAAIEIQNNRAASLTASAAQVRRPIYGSSSGRWRRYRAHLGPLREALHAQGVPLPE